MNHKIKKNSSKKCTTKTTKGNQITNQIKCNKNKVERNQKSEEI